MFSKEKRPEKFLCGQSTKQAHLGTVMFIYFMWIVALPDSQVMLTFVDKWNVASSLTVLAVGSYNKMCRLTSLSLAITHCNIWCCNL
jgi:hypothetical protein